MRPSQILWVDLRTQRDQPSLYHLLTERWPVCCISDTERLIDRIGTAPPVLFCFEYDYPDARSLLILQEARKHFPTTPLIMITVQHSEALAVWALRNHLWDYLVKPLSRRELLASAESSLSSRDGRPRPAVDRINPIPVDLRLDTRARKATLPACSFVEKHCHEKIVEREVASLCGMNVSTFSRAFKREHGMTFRDYLINYRIHKAQSLLRYPHISIQDVAYTVGFRDPSYFTRMFRRIVGTSPSHYQRELLSRPGETKNEPHHS